MPLPDATTNGHFWIDDATGRLWLQERLYEAVGLTLIAFIDGYYKPKYGEPQTPERHIVLMGDPDHGLRLMPEPIIDTLAREREEQSA